MQDHLALIGVPDGESPTIQTLRRDRRLGSKRFSGQETIMRVGWSCTEKRNVGEGFSGEWSVRTGVTLVFSSSDGMPLARVSPSAGAEPRLQRESQLQLWLSGGLLVRGSDPEAGSAVPVTQAKGVFRAAATARTLHIIG